MSAISIRDERMPWQRQPNEPAHWFSRFADYLDQVPPRSLLRVFRAYSQQAEKGGRRRSTKPAAEVNRFPSSWAAARDKYQWLARADAYDREQAAERERQKRQARHA